MAPGVRALQLAVAGGISARERDGEGDMEDVRLLDACDREEARRSVQVKVTGMTCSACSTSVEAALSALHGVSAASVSLLQNTARVVFDPSLVTDDDIKNAIEDAGFDAEILPDSKIVQKKPQQTLSGQFRIGGMTCTNCVNSVEGILLKLPGVKRAVVALATSLGEVEYDPSFISKDEIVQAIEDAGFDSAFLESSERDKTILSIDGLHKDIDMHTLEAILGDVKGVKLYNVSRELAEVEVIFDTEVVGLRFIVDAVEKGSNGRLKAHVRNPYTNTSSADTQEAAKMFRLFISSFLLSVPLFLIKVVCPRIHFMSSILRTQCGPFPLTVWLNLVLVTIIQFVIGRRFYKAAYRALRNGSTNMDVLVAIGTSASYFYSISALIYRSITGIQIPIYFETSAMLITFVLMGKYLEVLAKGKTSDAIKKLVELAPATALLLEKDADGKYIKEREIDALLIQPGDILKVIPGSKVPVDGVVVWGMSHVNESMVTGESVPVQKEISSGVIGGTINLHGVLHVKAIKVGSNTVLSQIITLVETAQMSKAPIQKFADFVSGCQSNFKNCMFCMGDVLFIFILAFLGILGI